MKLLFISPTPPSDASFGSAQRSSWLYRALREIGEVDVLLLREGESASVRLRPSPDVIAEIVFRGNRFRRYTVDDELARFCISHLDARAYDAIVVRYVSLAAALPHLGPPTVVDADDALYRYPSAANVFSRWTAASRGWLRVAVGRRALKRFAHVWFCSERDRAALSIVASSILPNIVDLSQPAERGVAEVHHRAQDDARKVILMVGSLWYGPNRTGLEWFLGQVWPQIQSAEPGAVLRLVGGAPREIRAAWEATPGVEAPGFVDDLSTEYAQAWCTIAPIWSGGGSQIKVLESLAFGKRPVATPYVAEAFAPFLSSGDLLSVAGSAPDMAARCVDAIRRPEPTRHFLSRALPVLKTHFSWATFSNVVRTDIMALVSAPRRARAVNRS